MLNVFVAVVSIMQPATEPQKGSGGPQACMASAVCEPTIVAGGYPSVMSVIHGPGETPPRMKQTTLEGVRAVFGLETPVFSQWFQDLMMVADTSLPASPPPETLEQSWVDALIDAIGDEELDIEIGFAGEV